MKKEIGKKVLASTLGFFVFVFAINLVAAWTISVGTEASGAGVNQPISNPQWLLSTVQFFNLGITWADFIVAMAVILMIFAAAYDILLFTSFESQWVKFIIAGSIAAIFGVTGGVGAFAVWMGKAMGGSVMLATGASVVIAAIFFVIAGFFKARLKVVKAKEKALEAEGGFAKAAAGVKGLAGVTDTAAKASG
jgi:hypothetical protein